MTLNTFADNEALWAGRLNALVNAPGSELVDNGCTPSKGTGDWDVDVASGAVRIDGSGTVSVSAQTVDLADPTSDIASGEERVVIVHINNSGTASATEGTAASSNPVTPDIPSGEVLVALVHVANSDGTIADSDLFDTRVIAKDNVQVRYIEQGDSITVHEGADVDIASGSWGTIFNLADPVDILGGGFWGERLAAFRVTWNDGSTTTYGDLNPETGFDESDSFTAHTIPPVSRVKKLEVHNGGAATSTNGWSVLTR